jgi:hypothetical protein
MWESYRPELREVAMSLNGIVGIGLSSVGVKDEREQVARVSRDTPPLVGRVALDNLSAVQEDYVTLNSGVGEVVLARGASASTQNEAGDRGTAFRAIA